MQRHQIVKLVLASKCVCLFWGRDLVVKGVGTNLKNEQFLVECVSGHGGCLDVMVRDVVSLDVHLHLLLLQMQQQLKLLLVVLPAQRTFQQRPSEQSQQ